MGNYKLKKVTWYVIGCIIILLYVYILVKLTLCNRNSSEQATYNIELFWCLKKAWLEKNEIDWYFIIGNIVLFIPMGILLPFCFSIMRKAGRTALVGFGISSAIEIIQFIYHIGLFEFDDIINNTIGTILGYGIYMIIFIFKKKYEYSLFDRVIVGIVWLSIILFIFVALLNGQPVFNELCRRIEAGFCRLITGN